MSMELVADECVARVTVDALRADGYDVWFVNEHQRGIVDLDVLSVATAQQRLLLTEDKDFGDIVFRDRRPAPFGVVLARLPDGMLSVDKTHVIRTAFAASYAQFAGKFTVIDERQVRIVALPTPQP